MTRRTRWRRRVTVNLPAGFTAPVAIRMPPGDRPFFLRGRSSGHLARVHDQQRQESCISFFAGHSSPAAWISRRNGPKMRYRFRLEPMGAGKVHLGFCTARIRRCARQCTGSRRCPQRENGRVITGHSLGAALATLCWADMGGDLMTFAGPRVGDPAPFATALWNGQTVRVVNASRTSCPTFPRILHSAMAELVQTVEGPNWSVLDRVLAHSLTSYAAGLEKL